MCTISVVSDQHNQKYWADRFPNTFTKAVQAVDRLEFEALKKEVEALKKLLLAAKAYDQETGQKDCEQGDKVAILKAVAKLVGVDLKDIFPDA